MKNISITSYYNGNKVYWDNRSKEWYYEDGQIADMFRKCPKCGKLPTKDGYDACLGYLPGVKNACCGHGVEEGYIQFKNDTIIRFILKGIKHKT